MLGWVVSIIELTAKYLTCKKNKWSFPLNSLACIMWGVMFIQDKRYGALLCIAVFLVLNVFGWIEWSKESKNK